LAPPIVDLVSQLPFTSACAVLLNDGEAPKVVVSQGVIESIVSHLVERPVEMGGLLLGNAYNLADDADKFVISIFDYAGASNTKVQAYHCGWIPLSGRMPGWLKTVVR
jgi:hypothetical protein